MNEPREQHTKWIISGRERQKLYISLICEIKKKVYKLISIQNRTVSETKNKFMITKGERQREKDKLGAWD